MVALIDASGWLIFQSDNLPLQVFLSTELRAALAGRDNETAFIRRRPINRRRHTRMFAEKREKLPWVVKPRLQATEIIDSSEDCRQRMASVMRSVFQ